MDIVWLAIIETSPLWAFVGILAIALCIEEGVKARSKRRMVDNPTLW